MCQDNSWIERIFWKHFYQPFLFRFSTFQIFFSKFFYLIFYYICASYLNQRCHYTVIGKVNSPMSFVNCGIPQGSILGPLLFLVYINDIKNACPDTNIKLFAGDANFFVMTAVRIR